MVSEHKKKDGRASTRQGPPAERRESLPLLDLMVSLVQRTLEVYHLSLGNDDLINHFVIKSSGDSLGLAPIFFLNSGVINGEGVSSVNF